MGRETNKQRREAQARTAREKAAAARGEAKRAEQRRRATVVLATVVVIAVVGIVIAFVAINHKSNQKEVVTNTSAATSVLAKVAAVPKSTLDSVAAGSVISGPQAITGDPLTEANKPDLLYIGAEFCPYCAGERWAMGVALSRFGKLSGVSFTRSASDDTDPNTATLDFKDTSFQSKYMSFTPVENEDRNHDTLQQVTPAQDALWSKYSPNGQKGFPFLDFGNKYSISGPTFDPKVLAGLTQAQIAAKLANADDPVAKGIDGAANVITATICDTTGNQPADVCGDSVIKSIQSEIKTQPSPTASPGSSS